MQGDDDKQDRRPQDRPERITRAQDGYPKRFGFGTFGSEYKRTWWSRPGQAIPKLKDNGR